MYYLALATDYDGTLAHHGTVDAATLAALERLKGTGRRLIMVTGRELPDLERVFPEYTLFDRIVAENGALIYTPATRRERVIAPAPPAEFIQLLKDRHVEPLSVGRSIVATWEPNEGAVLDAIRELGLELQIIFNKGAVMVLPSGVNKATGLEAALEELELSAHNVVGIGDAENDHAFMRACGCAAAVANALPMLKEKADRVLTRDHGAGVAELIDLIVEDDTRLITPARHGIAFGVTQDRRECRLEPHAGSVLIAGSSGIGKSTLATALTENMAAAGFEFCVFDPEGDYDELEHAISVGDAETPPQNDEVLKLLGDLRTNVVVNTQCFSIVERPTYFADLLPQIAALRARVGRPHWLLIDEAHHLLPAERQELSLVLPDEMPAVVLITVHPETLAQPALATVGTVIALGERAHEVIETVARAQGVPAPTDMPRPAEDEVLVWRPRSAEVTGGAPVCITPYRPRQARHRHTRKYAEGRLGDDLSFYFRGPNNTLNLRAHNLMLFTQIAEGVDDATWEHHRRANDYSRWFREVIKDEALAEEAAEIEAAAKFDAAESRKRISAAVQRRYTAPAS